MVNSPPPQAAFQFWSTRFSSRSHTSSSSPWFTGWLARAVTEELAPLMDPEPLYLRRPDAMAQGPRKQVTP